MRNGRPGSIVGSRIKVTNTDRSEHMEEIVEWDPQQRLQLRLQGFSAPLSRLATSFEETWSFTPEGEGVRAVRSLALHPTSVFSWPLLWVLSFLLKKAIARHLREMK